MVNAGLYFGLYSVRFFLPQVIAGLHPQATVTTIGWAVAGCYTVAAAVLIAWSRHSDHTGERTWHLALPALTGATALAATVSTGSRPLLLVGITAATAGVFAAIPVFWSLPAAFATGGFDTGLLMLATFLALTGTAVPIARTAILRTRTG